MKTRLLRYTGALILLASGHLLAQQIFPLYIGTVPAEMHLYPKGGHGFGLNNKTTKDLWTDRLRNWFEANGWLTK